MITENKNDDGAVTYTVRVFLKSRLNPALRITKQKKGFRTRLEAEREQARLKKECVRELSVTEARGILFCDLVDEWYEYEVKMKVETGRSSMESVNDYLGSTKKWFGQYLRRPAVELTPYAVVQTFEKMKAQNMSLGHQKKMKQVLKSIFDLGIQCGRLPSVSRSPTLEVAIKRTDEKKPEILTIGEIQKLVGLAHSQDHRWKRIWSVALLTGMRSGELYALTWKDVDFESKLINCNKSYNCKIRGFKSTKSGYWRQVPISPQLEAVLLEQQRETGSSEHVFDRHWEWEKGLQAKVLRRFCYINGLPSIRFHTLRACFATQMLRQGVEAAKVMKICGWKELKTMQHYVRLAGIEIDGATDNLKIFTDFFEASKTMLRGVA